MSAGTEDAATGAGAWTRAYRPVRRGGGDARLVAGVCAGLGRATGVDPIVYRVAVVMLTVAGGAGVPVYVAGWLLLPAEDQPAAPLEYRLGRRYTTEDVLTVLGAIVAAGFLLSLLGGPGGSTLVMLVVLALGVLTAQKRGVDITHLLRTLPTHLRGHHRPAPGTPGAPGPAGASPDAGPGLAAPAGAAFAAEATMGAHPQTKADAGPEPEAGPTAGPGPGTGTAAGAGPAHSAGGRPDGLIDLGAYDRARRSGASRGTAGPEGSAAAGTAAFGAAGGPGGGDPYGATVPFGAGGPGAGGGYGAGPYDLGASPGAAGYRQGPRGHWLGGLFFFAACGACAWAMATSAPLHGWDGVVTYEYGAAAALITIGIGLVVGAWFGRTRALVFWGVLLAIALVALPMVGTGTGSVRGFNTHWRPATAAQASRTFHMGVGAGHLDLTRVPLDPKHPLRVDATLKAGALRILVPRKARVHIDGTVGLGDIRSEDRVYGSHDHRVRATLNPPGRIGKRTPVIDLHLRGLVGDMEVRRAA